jgi:hypothetical protein
MSLGVYPLTSIISVTIDGDVVDPAEYRIDDKRWLVRVADDDGNRRSFPCCQRMDRPPDQADTMEVTFTYGTMPPPGGSLSAAIWAGELALSLSGSNACRLPRRVQQVNRQGVTIVMYPTDLISKGYTGLAEVDGWLASVNPKRIRSRAKIHSPDRGPAVRRPEV